MTRYNQLWLCVLVAAVCFICFLAGHEYAWRCPELPPNHPTVSQLPSLQQDGRLKCFYQIEVTRERRKLGKAS